MSKPRSSDVGSHTVKPKFAGRGEVLCSVFGCAKPVTHLFNDRCTDHQKITRLDAALITKHK